MENTFASLPISEAIIKATEELGFTQMTEIQQKAIPVMLAGKDLIAKAPTGTGKTCAFGIPVIEHIDPDLPQIQAIVLAPTRELATQICDDIRNLTRFLPQIKTVVVYGGQSMERQKQQLRKNPQILIATPGRLLDLMQHRALSLQAVSTAVLDEADKMLDMGFYKDVRKILDSLKGLKQMCMFSATISREVMDIGWLYQRDPEEITVLPVQDSEPKIDQYSIQCIGREKIEIILRPPEDGRPLLHPQGTRLPPGHGFLQHQVHHRHGRRAAARPRAKHRLPARRYAPVRAKQNHGAVQSR